MDIRSKNEPAKEEKERRERGNRRNKAPHQINQHLDTSNSSLSSKASARGSKKQNLAQFQTRRGRERERYHCALPCCFCCCSILLRAAMIISSLLFCRSRCLSSLFCDQPAPPEAMVEPVSTPVASATLAERLYLEIKSCPSDFVDDEGAGCWGGTPVGGIAIRGWNEGGGYLPRRSISIIIIIITP